MVSKDVRKICFLRWSGWFVGLVTLVIAAVVFVFLDVRLDKLVSEQRAISISLTVLSTYFWICLFGTLIPGVAFLALRRRAKVLRTVASPPPFISIIIPAYNEEEKVAQAIDAALQQDYPLFEVIVVDDGSDDHTRFIAESYGVQLIHQKRNGGKYSALNAGVAAARGEIVVTSDSDSVLSPDALRMLAPHFEDADVGAVAGVICPLSTRGLVRKLQWIEYVWGQEVIKLAQMGSRASVTICPGPISAFRRAALQEIGGFKSRTVTEDFDATLEAISAGWTVTFEPRAIALTDAPATLKSLAQQRLRWNRGALQAFVLHRNMFFSRSAGMSGLLWLPWFFLSAYGVLAIDLAVLGIFGLLFLLTGLVPSLLTHGMIYMLLIEAVVILQYVLGLYLAGERRPSLYAATVFMKVLNIVLVWTRIKAVHAELRGKVATW